MPAVEILINTHFISDLIFKREVTQIKEVMKKEKTSKMRTFDQGLYEKEKITFEDDLKNADSANDFRLNVKLNSKLGLPETHTNQQKNLKMQFE